MLSYQTVNEHTLELLKHLSAVPEFAAMRLVGGTSLALQYGHRTSVDLDGSHSKYSLMSLAENINQ